MSLACSSFVVERSTLYRSVSDAITEIAQVSVRQTMDSHWRQPRSLGWSFMGQQARVTPDVLGVAAAVWSMIH